MSQAPWSWVKGQIKEVKQPGNKELLHKRMRKNLHYPGSSVCRGLSWEAEGSEPYLQLGRAWTGRPRRQSHLLGGEGTVFLLAGQHLCLLGLGGQGVHRLEELTADRSLW